MQKPHSLAFIASRFIYVLVVDASCCSFSTAVSGSGMLPGPLQYLSITWHILAAYIPQVVRKKHARKKHVTGMPKPKDYTHVPVVDEHDDYKDKPHPSPPAYHYPAPASPSPAPYKAEEPYAADSEVRSLWHLHV